MGQVLAFAVGVSISPIPIIGIVLMLATPRGRVNGPTFLVGWVVGIFVTGALVIFVLGDTLGSGETSTRGAWVDIVLGVALLAVARRQFAKRPKGDEEPKLPGWMTSVDHFDPLRAFALGIALTVLNPKNLVLILGAAAAIAETASSNGDELAALLFFTAIALIGPLIPVIIYFAMNSRADELLGRMRTWLASNNAVVMAVICLIIAAKFIGDGISVLAS